MLFIETEEGNLINAELVKFFHADEEGMWARFHYEIGENKHDYLIHSANSKEEAEAFLGGLTGILKKNKQLISYSQKEP
jgi:hypothetical protein